MIKIKTTFKVNPRAGKELAREMKKNARKKGIKLEVNERELQKAIERSFR